MLIEYPPIWSNAVVDKLLMKHHVTVAEVEEAMFEDSPRFLRGERGTWNLFGQTAAGRYLLVVLSKKEGSGKYKVVTARDMSHSERARCRTMNPGSGR